MPPPEKNKQGLSGAAGKEELETFVGNFPVEICVKPEKCPK
jgi:hypothetical protein